MKIFTEMMGKTFDMVKVFKYDNLPVNLYEIFREYDVTRGDEEIVFVSKDFLVVLSHYQECCESVSIKDIVGDLSDLENSSILEAELVTGTKWNEENGESETWSFYKFGTQKGFVTISWCGTSNGYYSETVQVQFIDLRKH